MKYLNVAFWDVSDGMETPLNENRKVLTIKSFLYPSYNVGDRVTLESEVTDIGMKKWNKTHDDNLDLCMYEIVDVRHSIKKVFSHKIFYRTNLDILLKKT
jgi:hypothetical protein